MKIKKGKFLYFISYSLFGLFAFVIFFLMTLPFDLLEEKGLDFLETKTGCVVTINTSEYTLPVSIAWEGLDVTCPKKLFTKGSSGKTTLKVTALNLSLALMPLLLQQHGEIAFNAQWGGGTISGHLSVVQKETGPTFTLKDLKGQELQVKEIDPGISGLLAITGEGSWQAQGMNKGNGRLSLTLDEAKFRSIGGQSLPIGEVNFARIQTQLSWKAGRVIAEQFSATGDMVDLKSESGNLILRKPLNRSLLALSLQATPKGSIQEMATLFIQGYQGKSPLKLRLNGPLISPQLSVNGRPVPLGL